MQRSGDSTCPVKAGGNVFIDENGGGAGVRLRKPIQTSK